jgi:hypothetical protein
MRHCPASVRSKQFATVAAHVLYMCLHRRVPTMLACALSCRSIPPQSTPRKRHSCWLPRDRRLSTACVQVGTDTMGERHLQPLPLPLTVKCTSPFHSRSSAAMGGMAACASWATSAPRLLPMHALCCQGPHACCCCPAGTSPSTQASTRTKPWMVPGRRAGRRQAANTR